MNPLLEIVISYDPGEELGFIKGEVETFRIRSEIENRLLGMKLPDNSKLNIQSLQSRLKNPEYKKP